MAPDVNAQPSHPLSRNHAAPANTHSLSSTKKGIAGAESCGNNAYKRSVRPRRCLRYKREGGLVRVAPTTTPPHLALLRCSVQLWRREQIKGHCEAFPFDVRAKKSSAKKWVEGQNGIEG